MAKTQNRFFRKVISGSREMTQVQTNVEQAVAEVIKSPILDGRVIDSVSLSSTVNRIEHKLGRVPRGYIVIKRDGSGTVYDSLSSEGSPELFLPLYSTTNITASIWVF